MSYKKIFVEQAQKLLNTLGIGRIEGDFEEHKDMLAEILRYAYEGTPLVKNAEMPICIQLGEDLIVYDIYHKVGGCWEYIKPLNHNFEVRIFIYDNKVSDVQILF